MGLQVFGLFLALSLSRGIKMHPSLLEECKKPDGYEDLSDSQENINNKFYSCQKEFTNQIKITNSILTMHSCSFTNVINQGDMGLIHIKVNNDFPAELSGNIEIQSTNFNLCEGGCIFFQSDKETQSIKIAGCTFKQCKSSFETAGIKIYASSGVIDDCKFIEVDPIGGGTAVIFYSQPDVGEKDLKLIISNCVFDHKGNDGSGLIVLENGDRKLQMTNNQFKMADSVVF